MELREYNRLFHQIGRMHHTLCENTVARLGIHRSQHMLLMRLYCKDGQTQKDLASAMQVSPAAVAVSLKKLEAEDYIRKDSRSDGRVNHIHITEKGKQIVAKTRRFFDAIDADMFACVTETELEALYLILQKIEKNLKNAIEEEKSTL